MKIKIFDESHEKDLEEDLNNFISGNDIEIVDIKFSTSLGIFSEEQVYCFTALVMYKKKSSI